MKQILAILLIAITSLPALCGDHRHMIFSIDQLTVPIESADQSKLLKDWEWLIGNEKLPIVVTTMGDVFVQDEKTSEVFFLDTISGKLEPVAKSVDEFAALLDDPDFVSYHFSTNLLEIALQSGMHLAPRRVFSFKVPPVLGGTQDLSNLESSDVEVHFSLLGQMLGQVHDLPAGTKIKVKLDPDTKPHDG